MTTLKKNETEFALQVSTLIQKLRKVDDNRVLLTAVAYLCAERGAALYQFMELADEAYEDALRLTSYVNLKELGYEPKVSG